MSNPPSEKVLNTRNGREAFEFMCEQATYKGQMPWHKTIFMGFLAGAYMAFASFLSIRVSTLPTMDEGIRNFMFGAVHPVGLIMIILAGAEVYVGNTMILLAGLFKRGSNVKFWMLIKNWVLSFGGNFAGATFVAFFLVYLTGLMPVDDKTNIFTDAAIKICTQKSMGWWHEYFFRGLGGGWLFCLAIFLSYTSHDVTGKILGIWWPCFCFAALGYEHAISNMFFVPVGLMLGFGGGHQFGYWVGVNMTAVTLGNTLTSCIFIALLYYYVYCLDAAPKCHCEPQLPKTAQKDKEMHPTPVPADHPAPQTTTHTQEHVQPVPQPVTTPPLLPPVHATVPPVHATATVTAPKPQATITTPAIGVTAQVSPPAISVTATATTAPPPQTTPAPPTAQASLTVGAGTGGVTLSATL